MSDRCTTGPTPLADLAARARARIEKHEHRLRTDPAYAAKVAANDRERAEHERTVARAARERFLDAAGVPPRTWPLLLDGSLQETPAVAHVRAWLAAGSHPNFLVLAGGKGTGKTTAACFAIAERGGRRVTARELAAASDFDRDLQRSLAGATLLVLDDLGAESLDEKGWGANRIGGLLDARYERRRATLIATNLTMRDFLARYGQDGGRLQDRLRQAARWVDIAGASMRRPEDAPIPPEAIFGEADVAEAKRRASEEPDP